MPDMWMDVDAALAEVPVNVAALIDDTDFKTREESVTYDQAGMDLVWNFVTTAGAFTQTAVTPTTGGDYDWASQGNAMYSIEMTATGGASINNDTEGFGWFTGFATGILPWRGPVIGFRAAGLNNVLIDSAYSVTRGLTGTAVPDVAAEADGGMYTRGTGAGQINQDTNGQIDSDVQKWLGTTVATPTVGGVPEVDLTHLFGVILAEGGAGRLAAAFNKLFDVVTPTLVASDVMRGTDGANQTVPDAAGVVPTAVENRTEMDTNSTRLSTIAQDTTTDIPAVIATLQAKLLAYTQLLARSDAAIETDKSTELGEINTNEGSGAGNYSAQNDSGEGIRDRGDAEWITATGFANAGDAMDLIADAIKNTTYDESTAFPLKADDAGATQVLRTGADGDTGETLSDQIDLQATAAKLLAYLQLLARSDAAIETDNTTELGEINANEGSGGGDYSSQTDANEAMLDTGEANWLTATSVTVSDKTGFSLSSAGVAAIWSAASALTTAFGTLLERSYQLIQNKLNITDATGAAALRTIGDGGALASWSITDDDTTTVRTEAIWV